MAPGSAPGSLRGCRHLKVHSIDVDPTSTITPNVPSICHWNCRIVIFIYQLTLHNTITTPLTSLYFCPMPPKATTKTKKWGQANRDLLVDLTNRQLINFTDTTHKNIEQVRDLHIRHHDKKNFCRNFHNYSAVWDLKIEYSGTRHNRGKMRRL